MKLGDEDVNSIFVLWTKFQNDWPHQVEVMREFAGSAVPCVIQVSLLSLNISRPREHGRYFADDIFKSILMKESACILIQISLRYVPARCPMDNKSTLVQIIGAKSLSEPIMAYFSDAYMHKPKWWSILLPNTWVSLVTVSGSADRLVFNFYRN